RIDLESVMWRYPVHTAPWTQFENSKRRLSAMWKRFAIAFVPAALVAIVGCDGAGQKIEEPLPHTTKNKLMLVPAEKGAEKGPVRDIKLRDDGQSPLSEVTVLPDGAEKEIFYKQDGNASRIVEYFPPSNGVRQLRSESVFIDGAKLQAHSKYREDKTLQERGSRLLDGTYELSGYSASGKTVEKRTILSPEKNPVSAETFNEKGARVTLTTFEKTTYSTSSTTKHFDPATGTLLYMSHSVDQYSYSTRYETFYPGTEKVRYTYDISNDGKDVSVTLFNLNGERLYEWRFDAKGMRFSVLAPRKNDYETYSQLYKRSEKQVSKDSLEWKFELDALVDKDYGLPAEDEDREAKRLHRVIEFAPGADTPYKLAITEPFSYSGARTIQYLNGDGKVVKEDTITDEYVEEDHPYEYDYQTGQRKKQRVRKDKVDTKTFVNPIEPAKPIDWDRMKYIPFEVPSFIQIPKITIREIKH
ncbi:MAG: hypothetical protein K2X93_09170, partial [Candidatus Obscuribacterales bacterium]|nr:hypothetical protein [Candidatus Obscuribacterales bacterium]